MGLLRITNTPELTQSQQGTDQLPANHADERESGSVAAPLTARWNWNPQPGTRNAEPGTSISGRRNTRLRMSYAVAGTKGTKAGPGIF